MLRERRALAGVLLLALLAAGANGCRKAQQPVGKVHTPPPPPAGVKSSVSGRVTYHGVGLSSGVVQFFGEKGDPVVGMVQMGGTYTVWEPPSGNVKIAVTTTPPSYVSKAPTAPGAGNILPERYADPDTSGLTLRVSGGQQSFDIVLTD
jgi:hypothetical protein